MRHWWQWPARRLSLRGGLMITVVVLLALALVAAGFTTNIFLGQHLTKEVDGQLRRVSAATNQYLKTIPADQPLPKITPSSDSDTLSAALAGTEAFPPYLQIRGHDNRVTFEMFDRDAVKPPDLPDFLPFSRGHDGVVYFTIAGDGGSVGKWRIRASVLPDARGYLVVAQPLDNITDLLADLRKIEATVGLLVLVAVALFGRWLIRLELQPLERIGATARSIGEGDLSQRVEPAATGTEVGELGIALNGMLSQLESAFGAQRRNDEKLRRFIADASHELRTPLTSIRGYAELFRRQSDLTPEDVATAMRRVEQESERMRLLVEELLLLAKLDEGSPTQRGRVNVATLATDAVSDARAGYPERSLTVDANPPWVDSEAPPVVLGDAARLRQVLANLVENACRHTPADSSTTVRVGTTTSTAAASRAVRVEVADQGPGLTATQRERVFERFYRVDESRSRPGGGSGLGLSIVAAIVAAHGGDTGVESEPGAGATFWMELPLAESDIGGSCP